MFFKYSINRTKIGSINIHNVRERTRQALFKDIGQEDQSHSIAGSIRLNNSKSKKNSCYVNRNR